MCSSDLAQVLAALPPRQVHELAVGRDADQLRVAVGELAVQGVEADDLGRAHEGEVLGPEEVHAPLAAERRVAQLVEGLRGGLGVDGLQGVGGEAEIGRASGREREWPYR